MTDRLTEPVHAGDHVRGEPGADLELVVYGDCECPYCTAAQGILERGRCVQCAFDAGSLVEALLAQ